MGVIARRRFTGTRTERMMDILRPCHRDFEVEEVEKLGRGGRFTVNRGVVDGSEIVQNVRHENRIPAE
jgi:hypothetical protein